jgi:hypothetical protein
MLDQFPRVLVFIRVLHGLSGQSDLSSEAVFFGLQFCKPSRIGLQFLRFDLASGDNTRRSSSAGSVRQSGGTSTRERGGGRDR